MRAKGGINKPSYYDFALLHMLGDQRLETLSKNVLATRRADGTLVLALWNLVDPDKTGETKKIRLVIHGAEPNAKASIRSVDAQHGNVLPIYRKMGSPIDPTEEQVNTMNAQTALPSPQQRHLEGDHLDLDLSPNALILVEIPSGSGSR